MRARKLIQRRKALLLLTVVLLLLGIHQYAGLSVSPTLPSVAAPSFVPSKVPRPIAPSLVDAPRQADASAPAGRYAPAHIELSTGEVVGLGQPYDLVVRVDPRRTIGQLVFTVSVDPQMLQIRSVRGSDSSSVEAPSSFIMEDGPATGQTTIRMDLSNAIPDNEGGIIAVVDFEALAPGTVTIIVSDLAISNLAGTTIPYAASSLTAQAEVLSGPL